MVEPKFSQALVTAKYRIDSQRQEFEVLIPIFLLNATYGGEAIARSIIENELDDMGLSSSYTVKNWCVNQ